MTLANSTKPKKMNKETMKNRCTKIRKEKKNSKKERRKRREIRHRTLRACPFEDKVGFGSSPLRNNRPLK
jgi:hypothetical protein